MTWVTVSDKKVAYVRTHTDPTRAQLTWKPPLWYFLHGDP